MKLGTQLVYIDLWCQTRFHPHSLYGFLVIINKGFVHFLTSYASCPYNLAILGCFAKQIIPFCSSENGLSYDILYGFIQ